MKDFKNKVTSFITSIPRGRVASYGQIAAACGNPRAARQVGAILRSLDISAGNWGPQISNQAIQRGNLGKGAKFRRLKRAKNPLRAEAAGTIVPWWRVLNNKGIVSIKGNWTATKELQRSLLIKEGVKVGEDYTLDIEKYRWKNG